MNYNLLDVIRVEDVDAVRKVLSGNSDPNQRDVLTGATALHVAVEMGNAAIVRMLIDHGAELDIETSDTCTTPLGLAAVAGHTDIVRILLDSGAQLSEDEVRSNLSDDVRADGNSEIADALDAERSNK